MVVLHRSLLVAGMSATAQRDVSSPHELMAQIEADAHSLDAGGRQLATAIRRSVDVTQAYEIAFESEKIRIYNAAKMSGERMPAEDIRNAIAHKAVDHAVYARFLTSQAEIEALKAWTRTVAAALSARQTLLNVLRDELRATP